MPESKTNNDSEENSVEVEVKADATEKTNTEAPPTTDKSSDAVSDEKESEEPTPELLEKIKKQVEFYFGDVNMQKDKFMNQQIKLDEGWLPMSVMLNFRLLAALSKNVDVILKALENSDLIEISKDRKKIRRTPEKPLPAYDDEYKKLQEARTVYLKGFPSDITIQELKAQFESSGTLENIVMRKYKKGEEWFFKGSIFILFKNLDDAKTFMAQESIKYKDTELVKLWMTDYIASKEKEKEERRQKKVMAEEKKKSIHQPTVPKGSIIHLTNIEKEKKINKDKIKEKFIEMESEVAYVDYLFNNTEGWVRLHGENAAVNLLKKLDSNVIKINDCDISCTLLEGNEEEAYINKIKESMTNRRNNHSNKGRCAKKAFKRRHSPSRNEGAKRQNSSNA